MYTTDETDTIQYIKFYNISRIYGASEAGETVRKVILSIVVLMYTCVIFDVILNKTYTMNVYHINFTMDS